MRYTFQHTSIEIKTVDSNSLSFIFFMIFNVILNIEIENHFSPQLDSNKIEVKHLFVHSYTTI